MGRLVDRASASGDIAPVQQVWMDGAQSILKQYPMRCDVVGDVGEGRDRRVVAIKVREETPFLLLKTTK